MDIAELVLVDVRQRLPFWETTLRSFKSGQPFILSEEKHPASGSAINPPKCFLPISASSNTVIDQRTVLAVHEMSGLASDRGDAEAFLSFCDHAGTIVYYACDRIEQ